MHRFSLNRRAHFWYTAAVNAGYAYIAAATFLFSTMEIALKMVSGVFNPVQMNLLRFSAGSVLLLPMALRSLKKKGTKLGPGDAAFFALNGFIGITISMSMYQLAIIRGTASLVAVLFSCNPVFVIPLAFAILREKIFPFTMVSAIVSVAGMFLVIDPAGLSRADGLFWCVVLSLCSSFSFALFGVVGKTRAYRYGGVANTCFSFIAASLEMAVIVALSRIPVVSSWLAGHGFGLFADIPVFQGIRAATLPILAYISLVVTGLGYAAYFMAIEKTSAAVSSLVFYIKPALAPVLAMVILGETIKTNAVWGIVLIVCGSAIAFIGNARNTRSGG